jgi:hypothetical protein
MRSLVYLILFEFLSIDFLILDLSSLLLSARASHWFGQ